jgi:hypothetical protein
MMSGSDGQLVAALGVDSPDRAVASADIGGIVIDPN